MMLEPGSLQAIGNLPVLEHLHLYTITGSPYLGVIGVLHRDSFPALRYLSLDYLASSEVEALLELKALVQNLTVLSLSMFHTKSEQDWVGEEFIPRLSNTPHLSNLFARFDLDDEMHESGGHCIDEFVEALETLSKLPLLKVKITGLEFDWFNDFGTIFSQVVKLELPDFHVPVHQLEYFASMSNLEHLTITLTWTSPTRKYVGQPILSFRILEASNIDGFPNHTYSMVDTAE
ncbi:fanconi anemia group M protein [Ceratobasidium sp. AG-Ba]|nr:fanconi anemia group M protein [Ceratobasidium sp. AG-Ba]